MRRSDGYMVVATPAPSRHQGGVELFYQDSPVLQSRQYASLVKTSLRARWRQGRDSGTLSDVTWHRATRQLSKT